MKWNTTFLQGKVVENQIQVTISTCNENLRLYKKRDLDLSLDSHEILDLSLDSHEFEKMRGRRMTMTKWIITMRKHLKKLTMDVALTEKNCPQIFKSD